MDQLYIKILSFYGPLSRSIIGVLDPIEVEIFDRIMPDKETFVKQKVESYRNGIRNHKKDVRTIGKYAFTSFYISPLIMNADVVKKSARVQDEALFDFLPDLAAVLLMLQGECK
jgi:hypothetical protein